jgi:hypothetical protein
MRIHGTGRWRGVGSMNWRGVLRWVDVVVRRRRELAWFN